MLKFPVDGGIVTIRTTILILAECTMVITSSVVPKEVGARTKNFESRPTSGLSRSGSSNRRNVIGKRTHQTMLNPEEELGYIRMPSDMTGRCVDFTDLNKVCPQDCYPLPEIEWKVKSLCCYHFKCFLEAYKGYHQIQLAEPNEEKTAFHTGQGVYCYTKMPFGLKNAGATYQWLVGRTTTTVPTDNQRSPEPQWKTSEAEQAFKQLKQHLSELSLLVVPKPKEELIVYLSATYGAISTVLMTERGAIQTRVYFISRALQGPELNYTLMEKLVLSLVFTAKRLRSMTTKMERHVKRTQYHVPAKVVSERTGPRGFSYRNVRQKSANRASGRISTRAVDTLYGWIVMQSFLTPWLRCIGPLQEEYVIREIHEGPCSMHARPRSVVAKAIRLGYYWLTMHQDARDMIRTCNDCQWGIDIAGPFPEGPGKVKFLIVVIDYFTKWIEAKAVAPSLAVRMPMYRTTVVDVVYNDEELRLNLDLLEERRERAAICEAKAKLKMTKYYNARVRGVTFRPGDFVYRSNDGSHAVEGGKLGAKWEGPYEVTEALGDGAYKLRSTDGTVLPKTCNIANLKRCYL
uniref:Reverse transcriptase domain-containing protein n=1 Tax=Tanacetum cinerariifolium TaxID=118510 RepID=A0A699HX90_TANCI|nr:hypothetical protein [Tanacetum cinerariifolium]